MRKNLLMIAAAATMLAACAEKETINQVNFNDEKDVIAFDSYHSKNTKAPISKEENLTKANGGLAVYAYKFPATSTGAASITLNDGTKLIDLSSVRREYTNPIFENTMVYYNQAVDETANSANFHMKFAYDYPRYWDKQMYYAFFAYAPQMTSSDAVTNPGASDADVWLDVSKGVFTFNTMHEIQCASDANDLSINTTPATTVKQYSVASIEDASYNTLVTSSSNNAAIKDYLVAPCQPNEKWHATDQASTSYNPGGTYEKANITVGFTFSHLLSKLNVNVKAKDEDNDQTSDPTKNGHEYKGIKSIYVSKLEIENLPKLTGASSDYLASNYLQSCQQNLGTFTNIYQDVFEDGVAGKSPVVTYNPSYYTSKLNVIEAGATEGKYTINGVANQNPLYILTGGSVSENSDHQLVFKNAGDKAEGGVNGYVDQSFTYYVAPNKPNGSNKYILNLEYYVEYLTGTGANDTRLEKFNRTIDLSTDYSFVNMKPSYVYTINLVIGLDQIYITVEDTPWEEETTFAPVNTGDTTL